jgi:hypothetical protein
MRPGAQAGQTRLSNLREDRNAKAAADAEARSA